MRYFRGPLLVILAVGTATAAPVPKNIRKTDYFPLQAGTRWEYIEGEDVKTTEVVTVEVQEGAKYVTLSYTGAKSPPPTARRVFKVVEDDVYSLKTENAEAEKPALIMKRLVRPTDAWKTEHQWKGGELWTITYKVGEPKRIKTAAGEFTALPIVADSTYAGKETRWYTAGIGLVRKENAKGETVSELKSFKPGQ